MLSSAKSAIDSVIIRREKGVVMFYCFIIVYNMQLAFIIVVYNVRACYLLDCVCILKIGTRSMVVCTRFTICIPFLLLSLVYTHQCNLARRVLCVWLGAFMALTTLAEWRCVFVTYGQDSVIEDLTIGVPSLCALNSASLLKVRAREGCWEIE